MFQKLMTSVGVGAAKVDTVLTSEQIEQGGELQGTIYIAGGNTAQKIDAITLKLCTEVKTEVNDRVVYETFILGKTQGVPPFTIEAGERKQVAFTLPLPKETPITQLHTTNNKCRVWLETSLDIDFALDPKDRDFIEVTPLLVVSRLLEAINQKGFQMVKADVEQGYLKGHGFESRSGCYQEIEFKNQGFFNGSELELSVVLAEGHVHCLLELDRSFGGRGDQYFSFTLSKYASVEEVHQALNKILD